MAYSIDVSVVLDFVKDKTYEEIVTEAEKYDLCVKYSNEENLKDLFLLANKLETNKRTNKRTNENEKPNENENPNENETTSEIEKIDEKRNENYQNGLLNQQANGIIFERESKRVVAMCQNKLKTIKNVSDVTEIMDSNNMLRVEYCEDGTMIRLYNYNDNWYTSTTRCMDARKSFWSSNRSFDELFWDVFDKSLLSTLDKKYTYVFVLLHRENRIVVRHKVNMLVYISRINNETCIEEYTTQFNNIYGIRRPKRINTDDFMRLNVSNVDLMKSLFHPFKRGIIIKILNQSNQKIYKIDYENYISTKDIRGNIPDIRMRYLELLNEPEKLELLEKIYNDHRFMFNIIKTEIFQLIKTIHKLYFDSHIKHTIEVKEENVYYRTLRQLHAQYKITNKPITFDEVKNKIYNMDKMIIKKLLNWSQPSNEIVERIEQTETV